jgi:hypothetical protein
LGRPLVFVGASAHYKPQRARQPLHDDEARAFYPRLSCLPRQHPWASARELSLPRMRPLLRFSGYRVNARYWCKPWRRRSWKGWLTRGLSRALDCPIVLGQETTRQNNVVQPPGSAYAQVVSPKGVGRGGHIQQFAFGVITRMSSGLGLGY